MYIENSHINKIISIWLILMYWIISIMIVVGGLTRLTDSGLSITEWQLFSGFLPPLNNVEWNNYFNLYKKIPEFKGGKNPENNCHSVIDKPESVSLVKPPTIIIIDMIQNMVTNQ